MRSLTIFVRKREPHFEATLLSALATIFHLYLIQPYLIDVLNHLIVGLFAFLPYWSWMGTKLHHINFLLHMVLYPNTATVKFFIVWPLHFVYLSGAGKEG